MLNIQFFIKHSTVLIIASFILFAVTNSYAQPLIVGADTPCGAGLTIKKDVNGKHYYSGGRSTEVFWTGSQWEFREGGEVRATNSTNTKSKAPCSENFPWTLTQAGKNSCLGQAPSFIVMNNCTAVSAAPTTLKCKNSPTGAKLVVVSKSQDIINLKVYWDEGSTFVGSNNLDITNGVCEDCPAIGGVGRPYGIEKNYKIKRTNANPVVIKWTGTYCGSKSLTIN